MSPIIIIIVMLLYATVGAMEFYKGNYPFALMWFGYSISNIALAWMAAKGSL